MTDFLLVMGCLSLLFTYLLLQLHQDSSRSYKEVCAPVVERCCFLFNEIRPATSQQREKIAVKSSLLRQTSLSRWKRAVQLVIDRQAKQRGLLLFICLFLIS